MRITQQCSLLLMIVLGGGRDCRSPNDDGSQDYLNRQDWPAVNHISISAMDGNSDDDHLSVILTEVERRAAKFISRLPLRLSNTGTKMKSSGI
jgi:hypothetical protein